MDSFRSDADSALETALRILEALQKARDAQAIAEEAISKAQGQITDIETSLDNVRIVTFRCCRLLRGNFAVFSHYSLRTKT